MSPLFGSIALVLVFPGYLGALGRLRRMEEHESAGRTWWFGYARDAVNLAGVLLLWAAFALGGLSGPAALVLGIGATLVSYTLDWLLGKWLHAGGARWLLLPLLIAAAVALLWLPAAGEGVRALVWANAPR